MESVILVYTAVVPHGSHQIYGLCDLQETETLMVAVFLQSILCGVCHHACPWQTVWCAANHI